MRVHRQQAGKDSLIAHQARPQRTGDRYERLVLLTVGDAAAPQWLKRPNLAFPVGQARKQQHQVRGMVFKLKRRAVEDPIRNCEVAPLAVQFNRSIANPDAWNIRRQRAARPNFDSGAAG
jgi:hypothetical protein